jgi:Fe-S oxidoreductase
VFRDELPNLFPRDERAQALSRQSFLLSEFLMSEAAYQPPQLKSTALVHGHCHHKAVMGMGDETRLLELLGLDFDIPDSGCCGMAGSFGFDKDKYELSLKIGELVLFPAASRLRRRPGEMPCTSQKSSRWRLDTKNRPNPANPSTIMSSRAKKQWKSIDQIVWVISSAAKRRQRCHYKSNRYSKYR